VFAFGELLNLSDAVRSSGLFFNDSLCCVTHPSFTSNEGPTARIFSRYVDVVATGA